MRIFHNTNIDFMGVRMKRYTILFPPPSNQYLCYEKFAFRSPMDKLLETDFHAATEHRLENDACDDDCTEHTRNDTNHERQGESLHRPASKLVQDDTGDKRGEVRVEDRREGLAVPDVDRRRHRFSCD